MGNLILRTKILVLLPKFQQLSHACHITVFNKYLLDEWMSEWTYCYTLVSSFHFSHWEDRTTSSPGVPSASSVTVKEVKPGYLFWVSFLWNKPPWVSWYKTATTLLCSRFCEQEFWGLKHLPLGVGWAAITWRPNRGWMTQSQCAHTWWHWCWCQWEPCRDFPRHTSPGLPCMTVLGLPPKHAPQGTRLKFCLYWPHLATMWSKQ